MQREGGEASLVVEHRRAKGARGNHGHIRKFGTSINGNNVGFDVSVRPSPCTDCKGGAGEEGSPLGTQRLSVF